MAQQQNNDNQMWLRKEKRDIFTRVVNTIIMSGKQDSQDICQEAKRIADNAFEYYPEPEEIIPITDKNEFEV